MNRLFCRKKQGKTELKIQCACLTDIGNIREKNEDNYYFNEKYLPKEHNHNLDSMCWEFSTDKVHVMGVFDGMGGEAAGELASYTAVHSFHKLASPILRSGGLPKEQDVSGIIAQLSDEVCRVAREHHFRLIGSTVSVLFFQGNQVMAANLGDSPIFFVREEKIQQIFYAHTEEELLKKQGISRKPGLTQFLGLDTKEYLLEPYIEKMEVQEKDWFLICSDGLTDMVEKEKIIEIMTASEDPDAVCGRLRDAALNNGGRDNITLILCRVLEKTS